MNSKVTVVDYGVGNIQSVRRALECCNASVLVSSRPEDIVKADRIVLPGVGAFADGMQGLASRGLVEAVKEFALSGGNLLGICLGMQMLSTFSEEFGEHAGLGLIPGRVTAVPAKTVDGKLHKVPHIGWNELNASEETRWKGTPLENTAMGTSVYLVHSFHMVPDDPQRVLAACTYGGHHITAAVEFRNIFGMQFHPEKSGKEGLRILSTFLHL